MEEKILQALREAAERVDEEYLKGKPYFASQEYLGNEGCSDIAEYLQKQVSGEVLTEDYIQSSLSGLRGMRGNKKFFHYFSIELNSILAKSYLEWIGEDRGEDVDLGNNHFDRLLELQKTAYGSAEAKYKSDVAQRFVARDSLAADGDEVFYAETIGGAEARTNAFMMGVARPELNDTDHAPFLLQREAKALRAGIVKLDADAGTVFSDKERTVSSALVHCSNTGVITTVVSRDVDKEAKAVLFIKKPDGTVTPRLLAAADDDEFVPSQVNVADVLDGFDDDSKCFLMVSCGLQEGRDELHYAAALTKWYAAGDEERKHYDNNVSRYLRDCAVSFGSNGNPTVMFTEVTTPPQKPLMFGVFDGDADVSRTSALELHESLIDSRYHSIVHGVPGKSLLNGDKPEPYYLELTEKGMEENEEDVSEPTEEELKKSKTQNEERRKQLKDLVQKVLKSQYKDRTALQKDLFDRFGIEIEITNFLNNLAYQKDEQKRKEAFEAVGKAVGFAACDPDLLGDDVKWLDDDASMDGGGEFSEHNTIWFAQRLMLDQFDDNEFARNNDLQTRLRDQGLKAFARVKKKPMLDAALQRMVPAVRSNFDDDSSSSDTTNTDPDAPEEAVVAEEVDYTKDTAELYLLCKYRQLQEKERNDSHKGAPLEEISYEDFANLLDSIIEIRMAREGARADLIDPVREAEDDGTPRSDAVVSPRSVSQEGNEEKRRIRGVEALAGLRAVDADLSVALNLVRKLREEGRLALVTGLLREDGDGSGASMDFEPFTVIDSGEGEAKEGADDGSDDKPAVTREDGINILEKLYEKREEEATKIIDGGRSRLKRLREKRFGDAIKKYEEMKANPFEPRAGETDFDWNKGRLIKTRDVTSSSLLADPEMDYSTHSQLLDLKTHTGALEQAKYGPPILVYDGKDALQKLQQDVLSLSNSQDPSKYDSAVSIVKATNFLDDHGNLVDEAYLLAYRTKDGIGLHFMGRDKIDFYSEAQGFYEDSLQYKNTMPALKDILNILRARRGLSSAPLGTRKGEEEQYAELSNKMDIQIRELEEIFKRCEVKDDDAPEVKARKIKEFAGYFTEADPLVIDRDVIYSLNEIELQEFRSKATEAVKKEIWGKKRGDLEKDENFQKQYEKHKASSEEEAKDFLTERLTAELNKYLTDNATDFDQSVSGKYEELKKSSSTQYAGDRLIAICDDARSSRTKTTEAQRAEARHFSSQQAMSSLASKFEKSAEEARFRTEIHDGDKTMIKAELRAVAMARTADKKKIEQLTRDANEMMDSEFPHPPFSGVSILRPKGTSDLATVTFTVPSDKNVAWIYMGTGNYYLKVIRINEGQAVDYMENGKMKRSDSKSHPAGTVIVSEGIYELNHETGKYGDSNGYPIDPTPKLFGTSKLTEHCKGDSNKADFIRGVYDNFRVKAISLDDNGSRHVGIFSGGKGLSLDIGVQTKVTRSAPDEAAVRAALNLTEDGDFTYSVVKELEVPDHAEYRNFKIVLEAKVVGNEQVEVNRKRPMLEYLHIDPKTKKEELRHRDIMEIDENDGSVGDEVSGAAITFLTDLGLSSGNAITALNQGKRLAESARINIERQDGKVANLTPPKAPESGEAPNTVFNPTSFISFPMKTGRSTAGTHAPDGARTPVR